MFLTGANRGLGLALAAELIEAGHEVYGSARESAPTDLLALDPAGIVQLDQADEASVDAGIAALAELTPTLDVLINCAGADARAFGSPEDRRGPFDLDGETFTNVLRVNVTGPMLITRAALPLLQRGVDAMIINISSQLGSMEVAATSGRDTAYCVSKAALNNYSVKAAGALRDEEIGVVMVHPGWVQTDMGGERAPMTVDESSAALASLVEKLTLADTGRFVRWDGTDHPW
ncbi:MAG: SDR family oxidoreductase [Acidimicrobiales bacterium]|nr:SDR family oxidoreductase [Acidimicrobiales bacterium]